ncbi:hypothetical protein PG994_015267 [Apiospora phragmitis]|uniref:Putative gamma-glutamylcyclotransferase n=1 Tax=Apiospora phragmitis TaxID=2905665 RepID=A0ABR1SSR5_9PEZI
MPVSAAPAPTLATALAPVSNVSQKSERPSVYLASLEALGPNVVENALYIPPFDNRPEPMWYFFYGTLTKPEILQHVIDADETPAYRPAKIIGYELASWGQYPALIDNLEGNKVAGFAFQVPTREQEEKLARYETDAYRIHCCKIEFTDGQDPVEVYGNTFMYAGDAEALKAGRFDRRLWQIRTGQVLPEGWGSLLGNGEKRQP